MKENPNCEMVDKFDENKVACPDFFEGCVMPKELARYLLVLIDKDLTFSFSGMGLPNNCLEWLENALKLGEFDKVHDFIAKRYGESDKNQCKSSIHGICRNCDSPFRYKPCPVWEMPEVCEYYGNNPFATDAEYNTIEEQE